MRKTLVLAVAVLSAACSSDNKPAAAGGAGGTMIIDMSGDIRTFVPALVPDAFSRAVTDLLFDHLAEIPQDLSTVGDKGYTPRLAKSWTWAPDSLSIAFSIDPRARWHDGKPVRASDVRFTHRLVSNPKLASPITTLITNIDSVSVRDSLTAVVWFKKHTPEQFYDVAYQLAILPEHVYGAIPVEQMATSDVAKKPIGSGRFRFVRWDPGTRLELIADTSSYRGRAKLDRLVFSVGQNPAAAATRLLTGDADFFEAFPLDQAPKLDSSTVVTGRPNTQLAYTFLAMNLWDRKAKTSPHPILGDLAVRRALSLGADRVGMLTNVFGKYGRLGRGPFPNNVATADSTLKLPPFDTSAAKALLDSAGWRAKTPGGVREKNGRPLHLSMLVPNSSLTRQRYAVLLQEAFGRLGAQIDLDKLDFNAFVDKQNSGDFDLIMGAFNVDPSIAGARQNWGTAGIGKDGLNFLRYSNKKVDALIDSAAASFDPEKAKTYARRMYQTIADDAPAIWLYDVVTIAAINRRLDITPFRGDGWWAGVADWSVPPNKRIDRDRIGLMSATP